MPQRRHRINQAIRVPQVRVIIDGHNLGIVSTKEAMLLASNKGLDLVEIVPTAQPPVCEIIDYSKFCYEAKKKEKSSKKPKVDWKEIQMSPLIGKGDVDTKVRQLREFLAKGKRVRVSVIFKNRQIAHVDEGRKVLTSIIDAIQDVGKVECDPKLEGKWLSIQVFPK